MCGMFWGFHIILRHFLTASNEITFQARTMKISDPLKVKTALVNCAEAFFCKDIYCTYIYTGCPRRNMPNFGRVFLMLNYTDITQNTYIQSWTVTEIMAREKCGHLAFPRTVRLQLLRINLESAKQPPLPVVISLRTERTLASFTAHELRPTR